MPLMSSSAASLSLSLSSVGVCVSVSPTVILTSSPAPNCCAISESFWDRPSKLSPCSRSFQWRWEKRWGDSDGEIKKRQRGEGRNARETVTRSTLDVGESNNKIMKGLKGNDSLMVLMLMHTHTHSSYLISQVKYVIYCALIILILSI